MLKGKHVNACTKPSILHFSLNKAATQTVRDILGKVAAANGMTPVSVNGYAFDTKFPNFYEMSKEEREKYNHFFQPRGYAYSHLREFLDGIPQLADYKIFLVIRDPRDLLVSMYYSVAYSHPAPLGRRQANFQLERERVKRLSIDEFVLESAAKKKAIFLEYEEKLLKPYPHVLILRYEDMVADFPDWLDQLSHYCQLEVPEELRNELVDRFQSMRPKKETREMHVRKGQPGDYLDKLQPQTIAALNATFADVLRQFGYE